MRFHGLRLVSLLSLIVCAILESLDVCLFCDFSRDECKFNAMLWQSRWEEVLVVSHVQASASVVATLSASNSPQPNGGINENNKRSQGLGSAGKNFSLGVGGLLSHGLPFGA